MRFLEFIKDKLLSIILIILALFTIEIFLMIYNFGTMIKIYIPIIIIRRIKTKVPNNRNHTRNQFCRRKNIKWNITGSKQIDVRKCK